VGEASLSFYGDIDRDSKGNVSSEYPAFYFTGKVDRLSEDIQTREARLKNPFHVFPTEQDKANLIQEIQDLKDRRASIESSRPKMDDAESKVVSSVYKKLGKEIQGRLYSYDAMHRGTASAQKIVDFETKPCIAVDDDIAVVAKRCNVDSFNGCGKITGAQAQKIWKICGRLLDAETNVETLRKDK
jgi:hypothetical protein